MPGHEIAARITEVGSDVANVKPGDHVVVDPIMACMECRACKAGRFNLCEPPQVAGFRAPGFARSQHVVPARNCHVAPASMPLNVLAFAEPAACARHCVTRMPQASLESVLVIGAGTIGLSIVQALRIMGAGEITVIEPDAAKRALSLKLGAAQAWALVSWMRKPALLARLMWLPHRQRSMKPAPACMPVAPWSAWAYRAARVKFRCP